MTEDLEKLLGEIEAENTAKEHEREQLRETLTPDVDAAQKTEQSRREKVEQFQLNLDAEAVFAAESTEEEVPPSSAPTDEIPEKERDSLEKKNSPKVDFPRKKGKEKKKKGPWGTLIYVLLILVVSVGLAITILLTALDVSGINKSQKKVAVTIPQGATTQTVAAVLKENGLIDHPLLFRLYSKLTKADGTYQPHEELDLSPSMGYSGLVAALQETKPRETVKVTIPEGTTVKKIAALLEKKKVCSAADFLEALEHGDYSQYSFLASIPSSSDDSRYIQRIYRLEGYLFPDTYDFYVNGSAEKVVEKMLSNFQRRLSTSLLAGIEARGMTVDEAVILASIIQAEVASEEDMARVSRVLQNRLAKNSPFPRLQCDTTQLYLKAMVGSYDSKSALALAYDTYQFEGLPVGAICNPGLNALIAATRPSSEDSVKNCYFFVTNTRTGVTYYSETLKQHEKRCREIFK